MTFRSHLGSQVAHDKPGSPAAGRVLQLGQAGWGPAKLSALAPSSWLAAVPSSQREGVACHPIAAYKIVIRNPIFASMHLICGL